MPIKLDKNVPLPRARAAKWPFATMRVGESFEVAIVNAPALRATASITGKRLKKHFIVRREGDAYRCWRDA